MSEIKIVLCTICATVGTFITQLFGGWGEDMITLLIFMIIDYITGIIVAAFFKKSTKSESGSLSSVAGLKGLVKKGVMLLIVLVAHRLDIALSSEYIKTAVVIGFISNETISIVENVGLMGIPLPAAITKAIEVLKHKSEGDDNGDK